MALNHDPYSTNKIQITAPYATTRGAGVLLNNLFGVALDTVANGAAVSIATRGTYTLAKLSTDTPAIGDDLYWDNTNKRLTVTSTSNYKVGVCVNAAGVNGTATIDCRLDGIAVIAS